MDNTLTLGTRRFPVVSAVFRRITDDGSGKPGWTFDIRTGPPDNVDEEDLFWLEPVRLYTEGDPIPLPDLEDLTGQVVRIEPPFDQKSGDVYFTLYAFEHGDVSALTMRFHERRGERYRITIEALAHDIEKTPVPLAVDTWIERQPSARYGA